MNHIENANVIAKEILHSCGGQKFLHIGSGCGELVQELLSMGMDACGLDDSPDTVKHNNRLMPDRFFEGVATQLPFDAKSFDTVIALFSLEQYKENDLVAAIKEIKRVARRSVYLRVITTSANDNCKTILDRNGWEKIFFEHGLRKHPSYYLINGYEALTHENGQATILLEKINDDALQSYPLEALKEERDLHMDMTREAGERSDAHIARYQWAATYVRPGDTVLDAACGLGYGSYLIQCGTMAAKTMGIDGSRYAIDYASANFTPMVSNLSFSEGILPEALDSIPDNSVDVVISFETLEHISEPETVLAEFNRVLTPGGRVIVSVPNDWSDESGEDPNPFHLHVYTLDKLRDQLNKQYVLENVSVQSATHYKNGVGSKEWVPAKRELYSIATDFSEALAPKSEWWLAVGMKPVLDAENVPYRETQFKTFTRSDWNVTAFARDYKNPWLVRAMVDIGHRQQNKQQLLLLAESVYELHHDNSADTGAALCVAGYQLLSGTATRVDLIEQFAHKVEEYIRSEPSTPHAIRWEISSLFVLAKLWLKAGAHEKATNVFKQCVALDPLKFSPLLANRSVEAYLYLGVLALNGGDKEAARNYWLAGIQSAHHALSADWNQSVGDVNDPVEFGLPELSSILDFASNCAYGLVNINSFKDKPWWWLQIRRSPYAQAAAVGSVTASLDAQLKARVYDLKKLLNEYNRLTQFVESKDATIESLNTVTSDLNTVIANLNTAISSLNGDISLLKSEITALSDNNASLNEYIKTLESAAEAKNNSFLDMQQALTDAHHTLTLKDQAITEQANTIHQLNAFMQTRLMRLRNVVLYQPWGMRKCAHISYLSMSLLTPRPLRRMVSPITSCLRDKFSRRPQSEPVAKLSEEKIDTEQGISSGYKVKVPLTKPNAPKIAHVIANFMTGGSSRLVVDLVEYLGKDYEQVILTSYAPNPPAYIGLNIEEIRDPNDVTPFINYFKRIQPDFIHMHYWGDVDEPWYAKAVEAAHALNIPVIENINTPIAPHMSEVVKRYVYVSDYVRRVFGRPDNSHITVYPGSDFAHFMRGCEEAVPQDCVGMVYRLERDKLNDDAIKPFIAIALKRPQTKVLIVGGGSLLEPFQNAVKEAGVEDNFEFTGYVEYDTLPSYYRRMSLFVAPVWKESFGQVSPFAMNMRVPVIGYDVGAISEIVNSKDMLAPAGDAEKLAEIAVALLDNETLRAKMGKEHQKRAEQNFSVQAMISAYADLYAEMAKK